MTAVPRPRIQPPHWLFFAQAIMVDPVRPDKHSFWVGHVPFGTWLVAILKPRTIVELGVRSGASYFNLCRAVDLYKTETGCFGVDPWFGESRPGLDGDEVFADVEQFNNEQFGRFSRLVRQTFDEAAHSFDDGEIELLHMAGCQTYEDVKHDFETWLPKLSPTAVVLLHATNVADNDFGVRRFWRELQERYDRQLEFEHCRGLGVLQIGAPATKDALSWLCPDAPEREQLRDLLTHRGREVQWRHAHQLVQPSLPDHLAAPQQATGADVAATRRQLQDCQTNLADARRTLFALEDKVVEAHQALADCQAGTPGANRERNGRGQAARDLGAVLASTSWRLTRPLRAAARLLPGDATYVDQTAARQRAATNDSPPAHRPPGPPPPPPTMAGEGSVSPLRLESTTLPTHASLPAKPTRPSDLLQLLEQQGRVIDRLRDDLAAIRRSTSWRATVPLRVGAEFGRRVRDRLLAALLPSLRGLGRLYANRVSPVAGPPPSPAARDTQPVRAGIVQVDSSRYAFSDTAAPYCYLEPRPSRDVPRSPSELPPSPLFSIVVPVYNTPASFLERAVGSVLRQWYPRWQLVLVDDASTAAETISVLAHFTDERISVTRLRENLGISGATNHGIRLAAGDWVVFMDHDDELTPDCLYQLAECVARETPDLIYSDEDKISEQGLFVEPHYKPDWSPDTMMSTMFTGHVSAVRAEVLRSVGPLRPEVDGCQDWDLVLRISERTDRIAHIPKVLYHWRRLPGSIAASLAAKDYVAAASRRVREDALTRRGLVGDVEEVPGAPGYLRVNYHPRNDPLVSIIIPTRDNPRLLGRCIDSITAATAGIRYEIVLVDNGSATTEAQLLLRSLATRDSVKVVRHDAPFNYSELNNIGGRAASGTFFLFLNDDTEVNQPDWLARLAGFAQLAHVGAVGAKLLYPDTRRIQHVGVVNLADGPGHAFLGREEHDQGYFMRGALEYNWLAVTGACLMVSREKFDCIGGFCEDLPVAYNDIDLCFRLRDAGYWNVCVPAVCLIHHESATRGHDGVDTAKMRRLANERRALYSRHPNYFQYDPFFSPNLHPTDVQFTLAV